MNTWDRNNYVKTKAYAESLKTCLQTFVCNPYAQLKAGGGGGGVTKIRCHDMFSSMFCRKRTTRDN